MGQASYLLGFVGIALCVYLLYFRGFIKESYPPFYTYLTVALVFNLLVWLAQGLEGEDSAAHSFILFSSILINHGFRFYLIIYLYRKALKEDYSSISLLFYITLLVTGVLILTVGIVSSYPSGLSIEIIDDRVNWGFEIANLLFVTLLVIIVRGFLFHVVANVKGMIYGLALMLWFERAFEILIQAGLLAQPLHGLPWISALLVYCRYLSLPSPKLNESSPEDQTRMLTVNDKFKRLDQKIFYQIILKARIYNPFTERHYFQFLLLVTRGGNGHRNSYLQKLYSTHKFRWCGLYYRFVDPILLGKPRANQGGGTYKAELKNQGSALGDCIVLARKRTSDHPQIAAASGSPPMATSNQVLIASAPDDTSNL